MIKILLLVFTVLFTAVGFSQKKTINNLIASPNPFSNITEISFNSSNNQNIIVSIKNVLGKVVFSRQIEARKGKIRLPFNRNNLRSGMYIYAIQSNTEFISKRLVIR